MKNFNSIRSIRTFTDFMVKNYNESTVKKMCEVFLSESDNELINNMNFVNRLIIASHNTKDARTMKQWIENKRLPKGFKSFDLIFPQHKNIDKEKNDKKLNYDVVYFDVLTVYKFEDTSGIDIDYKFPIIQIKKILTKEQIEEKYAFNIRDDLNLHEWFNMFYNLNYFESNHDDQIHTYAYEIFNQMFYYIYQIEDRIDIKPVYTYQQLVKEYKKNVIVLFKALTIAAKILEEFIKRQVTITRERFEIYN